MPRIEETGEYVDIICNKLGVFNRMNPAQIYMVELSFILEKIRHRMMTFDNLKDKRELLFKAFAIINKGYHDKMLTKYQSLSTEDKELFIREHEAGPIYVHVPPFWDNIKLKVFEILYKEFPWIELYQCTIEKHGRRIPILKPMMIGNKYMIRLKHSAKGKFSARSTGHINIKGVPAKSLSAKQHRALYSKTPVRQGEMEFDNIALISTLVPLARTAMLHSSSTQGRRKTSALFIEDPTYIPYIELGEIRNRNVDSLFALFKAAGITYRFEKEEYFQAPINQSMGPTLQNAAKLKRGIDPFIIYPETDKDILFGPIIARKNKKVDPFIELETD